MQRRSVRHRHLNKYNLHGPHEFLGSYEQSSIIRNDTAALQLQTYSWD